MALISPIEKKTSRRNTFSLTRIFNIQIYAKPCSLPESTKAVPISNKSSFTCTHTECYSRCTLPENANSIITVFESSLVFASNLCVHTHTVITTYTINDFPSVTFTFIATIPEALNVLAFYITEWMIHDLHQWDLLLLLIDGDVEIFSFACCAIWWKVKVIRSKRILRDKSAMKPLNNHP